MAIKVFKESEVRSAILKKAPIVEKSGNRSPHKTVWLTFNSKKLSHFRVPNNHKKEFSPNKGKEVAKKLFLTNEQYNLFVKCDLSKDEYLEVLSDLIVRGHL
jgi:hypothetical protein